MDDVKMQTAMLVQRLMFEYENLTEEQLHQECQQLPLKIRRWIVANHPDNRARKVVLRTTNVAVGEDAVINSGLVISDNYKPLLRIGARAAISPNVIVICASAPNNSALRELPELQTTHIVERNVVLDSDSWIGAGAIILPGVHVGEGAIVGAGSVVTADVPAWTCCAGVPARVTRHLQASSTPQLPQPAPSSEST